MLISDKMWHCRILTVLRLSWPKAVRSTGPRAFHALSFKDLGASDYYYNKKTVHSKTGDVLYCPRGVGYTQKHEASTVYVVHFDCPEGPETQDFEVFRPENPEIFRELFKQMYEMWNSRNAGFELFVQSIFYMVLYMIRQGSGSRSRSESKGRIDNLIEYIDRYFTDSSLNVARLAEMYGTSDSYLRRVFLERTGMTPYRYITEMRLSNAKSLLKTGYFTIAEVARKSGFTDQKYFSRLFREKTGKTPSEYEKEHLPNETEV